jgi:hypothetical protein
MDQPSFHGISSLIVVGSPRPKRARGHDPEPFLPTDRIQKLPNALEDQPLAEGIAINLLPRSSKLRRWRRGHGHRPPIGPGYRAGE